MAHTAKQGPPLENSLCVGWNPISFSCSAISWELHSASFLKHAPLFFKNCNTLTFFERYVPLYIWNLECMALVQIGRNSHFWASKKLLHQWPNFKVDSRNNCFINDQTLVLTWRRHPTSSHSQQTESETTLNWTFQTWSTRRPRGVEGAVGRRQQREQQPPAVGVAAPCHDTRDTFLAAACL